MLANNQRQGPLNVIDVCGDARLLRELSLTSPLTGCRDVIYTVITSAPALTFSSAGILEESDVFFRLTIKEKTPSAAEKSAKGNLERVKTALLCFQFVFSVFLVGQEGTMRNHLNIVVMHLTFVSQQIPLVMR